MFTANLGLFHYSRRQRFRFNNTTLLKINFGKLKFD